MATQPLRSEDNGLLYHTLKRPILHSNEQGHQVKAGQKVAKIYEDIHPNLVPVLLLIRIKWHIAHLASLCSGAYSQPSFGVITQCSHPEQWLL